MFGKENRKYKLIPVGLLSNPVQDIEPQKMYQLKALRDIPLHNVKKGDLGGYVQEVSTLSHEGACWVGGQAQVVYNVRISGDSLIDGNAVVDGENDCPIFIKDDVLITDNAQVVARRDRIKDMTFYIGMTLQEDLNIKGHAFVRNLTLGSGDASIEERARVLEAEEISGSSIISGRAEIKNGAMVIGDSIVGDYETIDGKIIVRDRVILEHTVKRDETPKQVEASVAKKEKKEINKVPVGPTPLTVFNDVMDSINAYQEDIVKIIKYPVMTDRTDPYTLKMAKAVNHAKRLVSTPDSAEFKEAVASLEDTFLEAESNAIKLSATTLSEADRKKVALAKDLLRVASDEASAENEKKIAFQRGFKTLEGVLTVPESAVDAFRIKVGLKEIEV